MLRPRDLCTAAYYDDVQRMRQLVRSAFSEEDEEDEDERRDATVEDEEEEDEEVLEMLRNIRVLEQDKQRREGVAAFLQETGVLHSLETDEQCGFLFRAYESTNRDKNITFCFKPSKRSKHAASPLHWAVLGCSHQAIEFLVRSGVDVEQEVPNFPKTTAALICEINELTETGKVLERAVAARKKRTEEEGKKKQNLLDAVEKLREDERERRRLMALEEEEQEEEGREMEEEEVMDNEYDDEAATGSGEAGEGADDGSDGYGDDDEA
ncbi:hypothetical protein ERJ75_001537300 [Trypanosoma vivax]|nr:hypothetical protein ERJ75_001537300 [Trypanosoma vivax]